MAALGILDCDAQTVGYSEECRCCFGIKAGQKKKIRASQARARQDFISSASRMSAVRLDLGVVILSGLLFGPGLRNDGRQAAFGCCSPPDAQCRGST